MTLVHAVTQKMKNLLLALLLTFPVCAAAQAISTSDPEVAQLLALVELTEMDGRTMAKVPMSLILQLALERSQTLKASRQAQGAAQQALTVAKLRNPWTITSSASFSRSAALTTSYLTGKKNNTITLGSGLSKRTDSGVNYGLDYSETRSQSADLERTKQGGDFTAGSFGDWLDSSSLSASVSVPLFKDGGSEYNTLSERRAEVGVTKMQWGTRQTESTLLQQIGSTYWDLVGILETVEVRKQAVSLSEKLLRDNQARLEAGMLSTMDVQETEIQLLRDRQSLLSARIDALKVEDQVRAILSLNELPVGLYPEDSPAIRNTKLDRATLLKKAESNDSQLAQLQADLRLKQYDMVDALNADRTDFDLGFSYTLKGYGENFFSGLGDFAKTDLHGFGASLTWTVPLGGSAPEKIQQRQLERQQLELQISSRKLELDMTLQSLLRSLRLGRKEQQTALSVVKLSEQQRRNEVERFRIGRSTSFQVSQRQQEEAFAKQQEIFTRVQFEKTNLQLLVLTGDLYTRYDLPKP
jgi:outer membrane protein TolC